MNISHLASIAVWSAVTFSSNVIAKDIAIYRWLDENNVVHFSQQQPQSGSYSQLTTVASYRAKEQKLSKSAKMKSSIDEQLSQFEQERVDVLAQNKEIADKNCKAAQLNEKTLNSFDMVMITDSEGKNRALSAKEKKAQLELSKKHIGMYCKKKN